MKKPISNMLIILFAFPLVVESAIVHVPGDQSTIQAGIDVAIAGDTVLVADGTYTGDGNRDIDFMGKSITVSSENGAENCVIDCEDNGRGFYFHRGEDENSVVNGFTIQNGYEYHGGGISCENSSPTINNCIFTENMAYGSGISGYGGGISCECSSPTIVKCTFIGNTAEKNGGGISLQSSSSSIIDCIFTGNSAKTGGGIYCGFSDSKIINCIFTDNAVYGAGGGLFTSYSTLPITNCIFTDNVARLYGGGINCHHGTPVFASCTIRGNSASDYGGGIACFSATSNIENCIVWQNTSSEGHEIALKAYAYLQINFSDVYCGEADVFVNSDCTLDWGAGMIDANPLFVEGPDGSFYLGQIFSGQAFDSPCVNAGSDLAENICFDVEDESISMDELTTRTDHGFDIGQVDIGYHYMDGVSIPTPTPTAPPLGMELWLSEDIFTPGDMFDLQAIFNNPGPTIFSDQIYVIVLDVYANYYWFPDWIPDFDYEITDVAVGSTMQQILVFEWPEIEGSADGLIFYAGMLSSNFMTLIGEYGFVSFGWQPQ